MDDTPPTWIEVSRARERKTIDEHVLVLDANDIASGTAFAFGEQILLVRVEDAARARAEIDEYLRENLSTPPREAPAQPIRWSLAAALAYAVLLLAFDLAARRGSFGFDWWGAGVADAAAIRDGAVWRTVTALFLHGDVLHLAGNLVFGAVFGVMLAQSAGFGLAWFAFVLTGAAGNWLNAWVQAPAHAAIGASTAVFGLLGVQAAHDWVRRRELHYNLFRRWAPFAIGAALLAWLGGDGRQIDPNSFPHGPGDLDMTRPAIDVGAHVLGFLAGLALGWLYGWSRERVTWTAPMQAALAATSCALVAAAWVLALR